MYLQQGKTHQGGKTNGRKHTYEQNIKGANLSVRERVTDSEAESTGKRLRHIGSKSKGGRLFGNVFCTNVARY